MTPAAARAARERLGLSLTRLAEALDIDRSTIWRYEHGELALPRWYELALAALDQSQRVQA